MGQAEGTARRVLELTGNSHQFDFHGPANARVPSLCGIIFSTGAGELFRDLRNNCCS